MVAAPLPEKKWGRTRPDPDCTGEPKLWPWLFIKAKIQPPMSCSTEGCPRKPGRVNKIKPQIPALLCRICRLKQSHQMLDLKF